jgi:archaellum component FlaC
MSDMTQTVISECSFTGSELHTLDESIDDTSSRLKAALADMVMLRKQLRELLAMKKENAIDQINKAKQYFESVEKQESELNDILGDNNTVSIHA